MALKEVCSHEGKLYYEFSKFYERIFTHVFGPRIRSTIEALKIPAGAKVLEVGVGTGLSLSAYPPHADVTAIDLAPEMLAHARQKVTDHGWEHIRLRQMDAMHMDFPDRHFDYVMGFHILSVVSNPDRLVKEILRVSKPEGTIVIINHFRSERRWLAPMIDLLDPVTRRLGWRTTLRFSEMITGTPLRIEQRFKTSRPSLFTVVVATKAAAIERRPLPPTVIHRSFLRKRRLVLAGVSDGSDRRTREESSSKPSRSSRPRKSNDATWL